MKKIYSFLAIILACMAGLFGLPEISHAEENLDITNYQRNATGTAIDHKNDKLKNLNNANDTFIEGGTGFQGEVGFYNFLVRVAKDLKSIFFVIASVYFMVIVVIFLFSSGQDEDLDKLKKGIIWITIGIIVMQLSYSFVLLTFDSTHGTGGSTGIDGQLAGKLYTSMLLPLIELLKTAASFFFVAMGIVAFYKIVTAGGNDESIKSGIMSVFYAVIGFLVVKLATLIVTATYSGTACKKVGQTSSAIEGCAVEEVSELASILIKVINWTNGFVGIIVVIMIIYTGARLILSQGEEEEVKKSKQSIIYIIIGIVILTINYLILTFFLIPDISPAFAG